MSLSATNIPTCTLPISYSARFPDEDEDDEEEVILYHFACIVNVCDIDLLAVGEG